MNGAHRESHHPACPLLLPRRRPQLLHTAHLLQIACFPKPRLFIFTLFSRCLFSLLRSGLPFFSALYFFRALLPAARFPRGNPAYVFPIEAKSPSAPCFAPAVLLPFSSIPACPLSYPVRFPFASPRSLFRLSLQSRPPVVTSLFPFSFPPRASAFRLNAILSVVTFPLHVTFPCSRFRLSPQCHPVRRHFSSSRYLPLLALPPFSPIPAACCHLPLPLGLSRLCFFFFSNPFVNAGKRQQKKPFPYGKGFRPSAFPDPTNKKTFSERTLKRFPFKMDQTNSMMTRRAASPLRGSSFMIRV